MSNRHKAIAALALVVVCVVAYLLVLKWLETDEARIKSAVYTIIDAAEERNLWKLSGYLHKDFRSEEFDVDRQTAINILRHLFVKYPVIRVRIRGLTVDVIDDHTATARFVATARAAQRPDADGRNLLKYRGSERFLLTFVKEDDDWKIKTSETIKSTAD